MRNSNTIRLLINTVLIFVPLIMIPYSADYFYFPKIFFLYFLVLMIIGVQILSPNRKELRVDKINKVLLVLIALVVFSLFFSANPATAIWGKFRRMEGLYTIVTYALLFVFSREYFKENNKL